MHVLVSHLSPTRLAPYAVCCVCVWACQDKLVKGMGMYSFEEWSKSRHLRYTKVPSPLYPYSPTSLPHPRPLTTRFAHQWGTLHPRYDESFEIDVTNPNATVHRDTPHCVHVTP